MLLEEMPQSLLPGPPLFFEPVMDASEANWYRLNLGHRVWTVEWMIPNLFEEYMCIHHPNTSFQHESVAPCSHSLFDLLTDWTAPNRKGFALLWEGFNTRQLHTVKVPTINYNYWLYSTDLVDLGLWLKQDVDSSYVPTVLWPSSHEYCVTPLFAVFCTLVGGPSSLINDLMTIEGAFKVHPTDDLFEIRRRNL